MTKPDCLFLRNPYGGGVGQHTQHCSRIHVHAGVEFGTSVIATHHALYGVSKEHPHGSACMNVCESCASKAEKRNAIVTEEIVQCSTT